MKYCKNICLLTFTTKSFFPAEYCDAANETSLKQRSTITKMADLSLTFPQVVVRPTTIYHFTVCLTSIDTQ